MLVLPGTPPLPIATPASTLDSTLAYDRSNLVAQNASHQTDLARYIVSLKLYLDRLFDFSARNSSASSPRTLLQYAQSQTLNPSGPPAWTSINKSASGLKKWTLESELLLLLLSIALAHALMASHVVNGLLELSQLNQETDQQWKSVVVFYKNALSFVEFAEKLLAPTSSPETATTYSFLAQYFNACLQLSILIKHSWLNRQEYDTTESFSSLNNSVLARVAVYVLDELQKLRSISSSTTLILDSTNWDEYLDVAIKYATAYAGYFLAIEMYQQNKIGVSLGLVNFGILSLQRKNFEDNQPNSAKSDGKLSKLKGKFSSKRNNAYLEKLQSITTLKVNKLAFQSLLGILLKDIEYLFSQLVLLRTKLTKENDNLAFQEVVSWSDIHTDSKWPIGTPINTTPVAPYEPSCFASSGNVSTTRAAYY